MESARRIDQWNVSKSTLPPTVSLLNILMQQGPRGAPRSHFRITDLSSSPRQTRRTARRRTCPKLLSGSLSINHSGETLDDKIYHLLSTEPSHGRPIGWLSSPHGNMCRNGRGRESHDRIHKSKLSKGLEVAEMARTAGQ